MGKGHNDLSQQMAEAMKSAAWSMRSGRIANYWASQPPVEDKLGSDFAAVKDTAKPVSVRVPAHVDTDYADDTEMTNPNMEVSRACVRHHRRDM